MLSSIICLLLRSETGIHPIETFAFIETNMHPRGADFQGKSDCVILKNLKFLSVNFLKHTLPYGTCIIKMTLN